MTGFSKDPDPFGLQGLIQKTKEEMKQQGKTVLAITGDRGIGKSTFCQAFIEGKSEGVLRTFFTPEKPDELIAQYSGETLLLAKRGQGRLEKSPGAFQRLTKVLQDWTARQDLVVVDEVGFLEETETEYLETLHKLIDRGRVVLVVRQDHHPHLKEILERPQVYVLDLGKWRKGQDAG